VLEDGRVEQAFDVGANLGQAAGEGARKEQRQHGGSGQNQERADGERRPKFVAGCGAMGGHVKYHRGERNRQQEKASPKVCTKNAPAHGNPMNLVTVYSFPDGSRNEADYQTATWRAKCSRDPETAAGVVSQTQARSTMAADRRSLSNLDF
jgi:hypothetical protein